MVAEAELVATAAPRGSRRSRRVAGGLLLGVAAAAAVLFGRMSGLLEGVPGLIAAVLLALLVPTSREFARRVLLTGCMVLGWMPLMWWWNLPFDGLGRATVGLAVVAGALGVWVGSGEEPGRRAAILVPRVRSVDLLVPGSVALSVGVLWPWMQAKPVTSTLGLLMSGWDNSAHFSMVHMIRRFGVSVDALTPPASGETWQFASYPQGFHTVVATTIELMAGPDLAGVDTELLGYTRGVALVLIAATTVVVAGLCALPVLRRRPAVATPVAAFVTAVFVLGPGARAVEGGFGNFAVACALVVAIALIGVPLTRVLSPVHLAALGGAVVGVGTGWALLLVLAGPALLIIVFPLSRGRWSGGPARVVLAVVLVLVAFGCLARTAYVLTRVQADSPLTLTGGIAPPDLGLAVLSTLATIGACLVVARLLPGGGAASRVMALIAVPLVGAAVAIGLVVLQVRASGAVTYYGFKFLTGMEIVGLATLAVPVAYLMARTVPARRPGVGPALGSAALALAATQFFGLAIPDRSGVGLSPEAPGAINRVQQTRVLRNPPSTAGLANRLPQPGPPTFFLDVPSDGRVDPVLAAQWYFALTDTWTLEKNTVASGIRLGDYSDEAVAAAARQILSARPDARVALRSEAAEAVARDLGPDLAGRIVRI